MIKITSKTNDRIKHLKKLVSDKGYRYETGEFAVEGIRALDGIKDVRELFVREDVDIPEIGQKKTYIVCKSAFESVSSTENSQGIIAIAGMNVLTPADIRADSKYVLLDGIQDPGNMGTIIRTACAFGFRGIVLTPGCVDPFSPKAARAAAGALWKMDVIRTESPEDLSAFKIIAADQNGKDVDGFAWPEGFLLAFGSEPSGLSAGLKDRASDILKIPMRAGMESLNASVSAGILMYLASRGRRNE